jgi:hypothetical protein
MNKTSFRLYFFYEHGCYFCQQAEGPLKQWMKKYPVAMLVKKRLSGAQEVHGWLPSGTPGYLLVLGRDVIVHHTGMLEEKDLEKLLHKALEKAGMPSEDPSDLDDDEDGDPIEKDASDEDEDEEEEE